MAALLLRNARIWTGDVAQPWAETALVRDGRFAIVGREHDLTPPSNIETIDAGGRLVMPGFIDGHAHLLHTGLAMRSVDLKGVTSVDEAVRLVAERVEAAADAWVRGAGWDQHLWPGARFPTRHDLDAVAPETPVALTHTSGHCLWVNSAALAAAGIDASTEAPFGGAIDVDEEGMPTGILRDAAALLIERAAPQPRAPERREAVRDALAHAASLGITGVHAMDVGGGELSALRSIEGLGELDVRVRVYLTAARLDDWLGEVRSGQGSDRLRIGGVKFFADGALGSLTAWMLAPYDGSQDEGLALEEPSALEERVRACLERGLAPAIHAIGDRANREVLDLLERTRDLAPELPRRIEHAQLLTPEDLPRFAALDVTASVQPIHATQDKEKVDRFWGDRGRWAYPFASLSASGANLAFGSDSPVETMDPLAGLRAAVTRRRADGDPPSGWYPGERLAVATAAAAYGGGCARAAGEEASVGKIVAGYHADFVELSLDLFAADPMRLCDARVERTVVGGSLVYRRD